MKIMIVDDHTDMRRTLRNFVKLSSVNKPQFFEFEKGEEAIEKYLSHKPDYVLLDIELQTISGFEVAKEILKKDPSAKIIMVTSYDTPGFRRKAKKLGIHGFVAKDQLFEIQSILRSKETVHKGTHEISN